MPETPSSATGGFTGGGGTGSDPCAAYASINCGTMPDSSGFQVLAYDPRTVHDANGCMMFNGCYVKVGNTYLYWVNQTLGYTFAYPNPPGTGGGGTGGGGTGGLTGGLTGGGGGSGSGIDLSALLNIFSWVPGYLANFNSTFNNLPATLAQALIAGNGPLTLLIKQLLDKTGSGTGLDTGVISSLLNQSVKSLGDVLSAQLASNQSATQQAVTQVGIDFGNLVNTAIDKINSQGLITDPTQTAYNTSGTNVFNQISGLIDLLNAGTGLGLDGLFKDVLGGAFANLPAELAARLQGYKLIFDYLLAGKFNNWSELETVLAELGSTNDLGFVLIDLFAVATIIFRLGIIRAGPIADELQQLANADHPVRPLDQNTLIEAYRRGEIDLENLALNMAKLGLDSDKALLAATLSENLPNEGILEQGVLRGFVNQIDALKTLKKLGYSDDSAMLLQALYSHIPGPADLTRIADKRVWSQRTDPKYGQYEELPQEYSAFMAQWGFDEQFTAWLWASHWNLPSPPQIFEMFHRGKIDRDDMETYLGLTDWLPFFRDKLLDISYNPLGRIDIKRAHNSGIIDDATALQKYKDIGYEEQNARILLEISRQAGHDNAEHLLQSVTDRVRTAIENEYKKGAIDAGTATTHLIALGIDPATTAALLAVLDHERITHDTTSRKEAHQKKAIEHVIASFQKGALPRSDAVVFLGNLGLTYDESVHELNYAEIEREAQIKGEWASHAVALFSQHTIEYPEFVGLLIDNGFNGTEITQLAQEADMKRQQRSKKPTEAQFKAAYKKEIISRDDFANELRGLGYNEKYVHMLIEEA